MFAQRWGETYAALESADEQTLEDLASLVTVAYILECLGGVLAADVEKDFLTAWVLVYEAWIAQKWSAGGCREMEVLFDCRCFAGWNRRRRTGAVVDLFVDDHVEVFL